MALNIQAELRKQRQASMLRRTAANAAGKKSTIGINKQSGATNEANAINVNKSSSKRTVSRSGSVKQNNNSDIFKEPWRYNRDGSRKTFDQLTTPEVLTWISTLPQEEQQSAAAEFERDYLKNPGSTRYDPYYTSYSNNDEARQLFGVNTFDQQWIDANRGYANYLTFTNESYTTPKKPSASASNEEKAAYQWWQIANTYEQTTQAAESEYAQLRSDLQDTISTMRASGQPVSADAVIERINWSDYKTLENLREASAAGNGRYLNRPVQVGNESIRSMVNAALRGEDITEDKDWVMGESEYIRSRPTSVAGALQNGLKRWLSGQGAAKTQQTASVNPYGDVTSVDYDPYYGEGSNNQEARRLFGAEQFDQAWIDANRDLMAYITFKDEDDLTPVKPDADASEEEKRAYQYWLIANTYEETTREGEKELEKLRGWMESKAEFLGKGATAQQIVDAINWEDYPTLENMRETAAAGNARMVNRPVQAGDMSLLEMAREITGEDKRKNAGSNGMTDVTLKQIEELNALIEMLPEGSEEREEAEKERDGLRNQLGTVSPEAAEEGNKIGGWKEWKAWSALGITWATDVSREATVQAANERLGQGMKHLFTNASAEENKAKAQAALASEQAAEKRIEEGREGVRADYQERILTEIYGTTETAEAEAPQYNEYIGSMRSTYGLSATLNWVNRQIARLDLNMDAAGAAETFSDEQRAEYDALMEAYQQQRALLEEEQTQRALIEERVYEGLREGETNYWGDGPFAYLTNRNFDDAKADGDKVPLNEYEAYLQYRMVPGTQWGDEVLSIRPEMAKYDERNAAADRAGLVAAGVEEGLKSANKAAGMEAAEHVVYWLKTKLPEYQGLTREEIYAIDDDLRQFRAWNRSFESSVDSETRAMLNAEYPVFSMISAGISEIMKMNYQSMMSGAIGEAVGDVVSGIQRMTSKGSMIEGLELLSEGGKAGGLLQKAGSYLPFALDSYSGTFETALNEGATTDQAMLAGVANGVISGWASSKTTEKLTQTGSKLFGRLLTSKTAQDAVQKGAVTAAKNGLGNALLSLLKTAFEEGTEEALEEVIGGGISKIVYDYDKQFFGEGGVIDPKAMLESGLTGALVGAAYPVTSGLGAAVSNAQQQRRAAETQATIEKNIDLAVQHIDELTGGISGDLGEAALSKAGDILYRISRGETVPESEFDELLEIEARAASVEDAAEALVSENAGEIEAAKSAAAKAEETAQQAAQKATEAKGRLNETLAQSKPVLNALNEGTASYADPAVQKKIVEGLTAAKAAKGAADSAAADAQSAREAADAAAQEAADVENRIRTDARAQAQTQVDAEMAQEKAEAAAAQEEDRKQRQIRPKGKAQPGIREMFTGRLTPDQRQQMNILDALGREYGIEFDIVDTLGGGKSAMYDPTQTKVITVALDAREQAYVQAGAHEMVHYIKAQSADEYTHLEAVVLQALKKNRVDDEALERMISERIEQYQQRTGQELSREAAIEEIVAEAVPTVFTDPDAVAQLVKDNRTLIEKVRDFFVEFSAKLREIAERYWWGNDRFEISAVIDDAESLREIAEVLNDALYAVDGGESDYAAPTTPNDNSEVRFSLSEGDSTAGAAPKSEKRKPQERDMAAKLVRKYRSDVDRGRVRAALAEVEDAYNNGDEDAAEEAAAKIAREIAEQSRSAVSFEDQEAAAQRETLREQYAETRKRLREDGISLTEAQKQEIASAYGSYNEWRRGMMGNVLIKNDAPSLEAVWQELSEMHPEMFPADTGEAQMPEVLSRFIEQVRPGQKVIDGMDAATMAAAISLEIQGAVLSAINKEAEAVSAQVAAEAIRDKGRQRTALKREAQREARKTVMREIAEEIRTARANRDDAALAAALSKYREKMGAALRAVNTSGIIRLGMDIRDKEQEISTLRRQIDLLSDEIDTEDMREPEEKEAMRARRTIIEGLLTSAQNELKAMHRQQMIERSKARLREMDAEDVDPMTAMAEEVAREDLKDAIGRMVIDKRQKVADFTERMQAKQKDYSQISTLTKQDIEEFFSDISGELAQNSEMARSYEQSVSGWQYQMESDQMILRELKRELQIAVGDGDASEIERINAAIQETQDRINVLKSRINQGKAQAQYFRRMGAQSLQQALREGRLAQPIMEWVIAACADASRQENWFNKQTLVKSSAEAIRLNFTTAARVWDDLFGNAAPILRAIYYDPVMDNETERQRWMKQWREKINDLKLTPKESALVQLIGENKATLEESRNASAKVHQAVEVFREFYAEAYQMADKALVRNGYPHLGHRSKYFPHIAKPDTIWEKLGIPMEDSSLPTSINGLTETFSPGHQYSGHIKQRKGDLTDYDALFGFEEYLGAMSNVIFHTDDIQRHRQLESEIRAAAKNGVFGPGRKGRETTHLSEFVKWIHEYTNQLAGKKAVVDRSLEGTIGRTVYRAAMGLKSVKGASAVCGNIASALTNVIPVQQVMSEHPEAFMKAVTQLYRESAVGRDNLARSSYIVRRFGSDTANPTKYTKFTKGAGWLFNKVDELATELVVYTYYQAHMDMGMDSETAMRSADAKAARLMGDRSKGAMPTIYGSQVIGLFTQFQYEVANQSQHFRKDIWRGGKSKAAVWWLLLKTMITGWLWNEYVAEPMTGRRPAADPLQMAEDIIDVWRENGFSMAIAQTMYNSVSEMLPYTSGGGRIAAFEGFTDVWDAFITDGATKESLGYAVDELIFGFVPMGGQAKKTLSGIKAVFTDKGVYNAKGTQLKYALDWNNLVQAAIFGPGATPQGQAYFSGENPMLTETQTEAYEQARSRGYKPTEAYANEAAKAKAASMEKDAAKAETENEEAIALMEVGEKAEKEPDISQVESQREEAKALRSEAMPGDLLSDYWWDRRNEPTVKQGIELWRQTGETWALPVGYDAKSRFEINDKPRYAGEKIGAEANRMYAEGYAEIMSGVNIDRMDEDELEELKNKLSKLKREVNDWAKEQIVSIRGE